MKIVAASLFVMIVASGALAEPPSSQPGTRFFGSRPGSYTGQIKVIEGDTISVYAWRFPNAAGLTKVSTDEKTVVVLPNGRPGKLSDLTVGQWGRVIWNSDKNSPMQAKLVRVELKEAPNWGKRLAQLEENAGSLEIGVSVYVYGKGEEEELHLLGPDHKGGYKEPFFARLTKDEMTKLLHYLALEGFLASAADQRMVDKTAVPPAPPYLSLSVGHFFEWSPLTPDSLKRLEGIKEVLPVKAVAKMEPLLARVRKVVGVPASQPAATQPANAFQIKCRTPDDKVAVSTEGDSTVFTVTSPSGIGEATIERKGDAWPKSVVLRLNLKGLESLVISAGKTTVSGSVGSGGVRLGSYGKDLVKGDPLWMDIERGDGFFRMTLPKALLDENPKALKIRWIDFFRG